MIRMIWSTLSVHLIFLMCMSNALADTRVTLCQRDDQQPQSPGRVNLSSAIAAGGHITFGCGGRATILLTKPRQITRNTDIDGGGTVTLDGGGKRMFFGSDVKFRLLNLTIVRGSDAKRDNAYAPFLGPVGGIAGGSMAIEVVRSKITQSQDAFSLDLGKGSLVIQDSELFDNIGALISAPNVVIRRSTIKNTRGSPLISYSGNVTIEDSIFVANKESIILSGCKLAIERSNFSSNSSTDNGGALRIIGCNGDIHSTTFNSNSALSGGAIWIGVSTSKISLRHVKFTSNSAVAGGAIAISSGPSSSVITLQFATFAQNRATVGGAIEAKGPNLTFKGEALLFMSNFATRGGAISVSSEETTQISISRGIFVENEADTTGGAVLVLAKRSVVIANSLFVRNHAKVGGSAVAGYGIHFINTTIASNIGVAVLPQPPSFTLNAHRDIKFTNTIITANQGGNCGPTNNLVAYLDSGRNLQYPDRGCGSRIAVADPKLDSMYVPAFNGPAFGKGENTICMSNPVNARDVYGQVRPRGSACSIGAVEGEIEQLGNRLLKKGDDGRPRPR